MPSWRPASGASCTASSWSAGRRRRDAGELLESLGVTRSAGRSGGRVDAPYQVGWCSWYHYFHDVTERDLRANLALAAEWPFDVFQLDDGYQAAIGDWLDTNEQFPSDASTSWRPRSRPRAARRVSGSRPSSPPRTRRSPPTIPTGSPARRRATRCPACATRRGVAAGTGSCTRSTPPIPRCRPTSNASRPALVDAGFRYLKLDFTFAPTFDGVWHDAALTPAQRVRAGFDAIRRGAGDETFILGCGVPLSTRGRGGRRQPHRPGRGAVVGARC